MTKLQWLGTYDCIFSGEPTWRPGDIQDVPDEVATDRAQHSPQLWQIVTEPEPGPEPGPEKLPQPAPEPQKQPGGSLPPPVPQQPAGHEPVAEDEEREELDEAAADREHAVRLEREEAEQEAMLTVAEGGGEPAAPEHEEGEHDGPTS